MSNESLEELQKRYLRQQVEKEERSFAERRFRSLGIFAVLLVGGVSFFPIIFGPYLMATFSTFGCVVKSGNVVDCYINGIKEIERAQ